MQRRNVVRSASCGSSAAALTVMASTTSKQARWPRIGGLHHTALHTSRLCIRIPAHKGKWGFNRGGRRDRVAF